MVSILPSERTPWDVIGRDVGRAMERVLPGAVQQGYNRGQLKQGLSKISEISQNPKSTPLETMLASLEALAGIPGSERYAAALVPELMKFSNANRSQNIPIGGLDSQQPPRMHEPVEPFQQNQQLPGFLGQQNQNFPTNIGPEGGPGNLPQPATTGQVLPLRNPSERRKAALELSKISTKEGIPLTPREALADIEKEEEDKKSHNAQVEAERQQRVGSQAEYGNRAVGELKKIYPESTPEMDAIFEKKGEQIAGQGKSEAEINRYLATEAKNFKNTIANVQKDLSAPRSYNQFHRKFLGTAKDFDQASKDLRVKLKPLLDLGLYDTSRKLLSDLGYYPEERESTINPFSERLNTTMNRVPKAEGVNRPEAVGAGQIPSLTMPKEYSPAHKENIKSGLMELQKADPNFDLVLARKAFEDKNYDWRVFKDALNELEEDGFKLTDDQTIQRGYLDTPPLDGLQKILHGLNLIGR